jgi:hypothetical protein
MFVCDDLTSCDHSRKTNTWSLEFTKLDRLLEHLIRSELNFIIRQNRQNSLTDDMRGKITQATLARHHNLTAPVGYEDFFLTAFYWRMSHMVPDAVKWKRHERVQECVVIASALTIFDFFRRVSGRGKTANVAKFLSHQMCFDDWAKNDTHRSRWRTLTVEDRTSRNKLCRETVQKPVGLFLPEPKYRQDIVLDIWNHKRLPTELLRHNKLIKDLAMLKIPQPINSVELLKQMIPNCVIILKPIDPILVEAMTHNDEDGMPHVGHRFCGNSISTFSRSDVGMRYAFPQTLIHLSLCAGGLPSR